MKKLIIILFAIFALTAQADAATYQQRLAQRLAAAKVATLGLPKKVTYVVSAPATPTPQSNLIQRKAAAIANTYDVTTIDTTLLDQVAPQPLPF
jgi:hypothetical protein